MLHLPSDLDWLSILRRGRRRPKEAEGGGWKGEKVGWGVKGCRGGEERWGEEDEEGRREGEGMA